MEVQVAVVGNTKDDTQELKWLLLRVFTVARAMGNNRLDPTGLIKELREKFNCNNDCEVARLAAEMNHEELKELCAKYSSYEPDMDVERFLLDPMTLDKLHADALNDSVYHITDDKFEYLDSSKIRKQLKYEKNPMRRKQLEIDLRCSLPDRGKHYKGKKFKKKK